MVLVTNANTATHAAGGNMVFRLLRLLPQAALLALLSATFITAALIFYTAGLSTAYVAALIAVISVVLAFLCAEVVGKVRQGDFGLDLIAALAMTSSLWFGEYLAGAIVGLMYSGGQFLEAYAHRRADEGMSALLAQVPRTTLRYSANRVEEVAIGVVAVDDRLLIRKGDLVPADGVLISPTASIDQAVLTGEPFPITLAEGATVASGGTNVGDVIEIRVVNRAEDSTYAGIVRLVEASKRSKAKLMRLADRFSIWFLLVTVAIAAMAAIVSGDLSRVVAVLVVATPCPLILAVPVALAAGTSNAAKVGVLVKGAGPLEALAQVSVAVFDKTGTLTTGKPRVGAIHGPEPEEKVLRLAASLDQVSGHVAGRALVDEARRRGMLLTTPSEVTESAGAGISGTVEGLRVSVGKAGYFEGNAPASVQSMKNAMIANVSFNGVYAGTIAFQDTLRSDAMTLFAQLRELGFSRLVLASGDALPAASAVARSLNMDDFKAELTPADKVDVIENERRGGAVLMLGDGVNDAPALAAADVGLAVGVTNLAAAAEAADVVLIRDDLSKVSLAIRIARRSRSIALQSVYVGIGLSIVAMGFAAIGLLPPVAGALLQEVIDVAVIMNALRALT